MLFRLFSNVVEFIIIQCIEWNNNKWPMNGSNDGSHIWCACSLTLVHWARLSDGPLPFHCSLWATALVKQKLSGQLALPSTIWNSYSLVMPITEKFQVLKFTFRESIYHLMRHPAARLQDNNVDHKKVFGRNLIVLF